MMIARPWLFSTEWEYVCGAGGLIVLVLAQVAILLSRWLRNSPAIRHTVLLSGLAGCLTVSVVAFIVSATGVPLLPLAIAVEEGTKAGLPVTPDRVAPGVIQNPSPTTTASFTGWPQNSDPVVNPAPEGRDFTAMPASPPTFESPAPAASSVVQFRLILRLAIAWIAGTCLLAGFAFRSVWQANGIRRRSSNLNTARLNSTAAGAATRVALRQLPEIRQSAEIHAPVVVGFVSPAVLLPDSVGLTVSDDELRDILIHELAHVRRRDQWVVAAQAVARAVLWPVPTIHWLNRELGRAREEVCDNFVLAQRDAIAYSELLLRLARLAVGVRPLELTAGMLNWRGDLEVRIGRLLDKRRSRATSSSNIVKSLFVAAFLLTAGSLADRYGRRLLFTIGRNR
jgi:beta-lactamase regulating signal transducer with metallopeptidase domain